MNEVALTHHVHGWASVDCKLSFFMTDSCPGDGLCNGLCVEERNFVVLVRPADYVNMFVQSPCCKSLFFFTLSSLLMQILERKGVRIAIISFVPIG